MKLKKLNSDANMRMHANDANKNRDLIHPELSYLLTGLFYKTHNKLGRFCREKQYSDEFKKLLIESGIRYEREYPLKSMGDKIEGNIVDFIIDQKILIDLKAKRFLTKEDYYQMLRYLECSKIKLGLLVNFRSTYLKPKRVLNNKLASFA